LVEIWSYLALEASETVATQFLANLTARFDEVVHFPLAGALRPHLAPELRVIFKDNYAIYYLPRASEILVVRVLHGSRDIDAIADQGGFGL
jgi:toxin ParE1/3/4